MRKKIKTLIKRSERGQTLPFTPYMFLMMFMFMAGGIIAGRIIYANAEIQKAADAAALAAAAEIDIPHYRDTGDVRYTPLAYAEAQHLANSNTPFLSSHGIQASVTSIRLNDATQHTMVTVSADISSLLPRFVPYNGSRVKTGVAETRIDLGR